MSDEVLVTLGPVAVIPSGAYDATQSYDVNALVELGGSSYVATQYVPVGIAPGDKTYWMLSAQKGDTGDKGEKGDVLIPQLYVDADTGKLMLSKPDVVVDVDFNYNAQTGKLEAVYHV